jgi:hypothetical protein
VLCIHSAVIFKQQGLLSANYPYIDNRVEKIHLLLLAARPVRRFSGIFLCTGLRMKTELLLQ